MESNLPSRRDVLRLLAASPLLGVLRGDAVSAHAPPPPRLPVGLVSRHVQWTTLEDAIDLAARIGFDAIEWNVRSGGHIEPARVERDLPKAVDLTRKAGLAVSMITTSIQDAQSPHAEAILATAGGLGIRYYRGGQYFRYDYDKDIRQQLDALKPRLAGLAALNDKHRTTVAYHTHSGRGTIGGNIWDFWTVMKDMDPRHVGLNYDIGHAVARGGQGWVDGAHLVKRHIGALAVKDFVWQRRPNGTWVAAWCPIGEGMIDLPALFALLRASGFSGPVNVHYEHTGLLGTDVGKWELDMSRDQFIAVVRKDLDAVRSAMPAASAD